jgi:hypothetical protein
VLVYRAFDITHNDANVPLSSTDSVRVYGEKVATLH